MMKKISILFVCCIISLLGVAQTGYPIQQSLGSDSTIVTSKGGFKGRLVVWSFSDTAAANLQRIKSYPGALIFAYDALWFRDSSAKRWVQIVPSGSSSADTLVWNLQGNLVAGYSAIPVLGTKDHVGLYLETNNLKRIGIGADGLGDSTDAGILYLGYNKNTGLMSLARTPTGGGASDTVYALAPIKVLDSAGKQYLFADTSTSVTGLTTLYQNSLKADKSTTITINGETHAIVPSNTWTVTAVDTTVINVLASPFNADPTGVRGSALAFQKALDSGFAKNKPVYVPGGVYKINDTTPIVHHRQTIFGVGAASVLKTTTIGGGSPFNILQAGDSCIISKLSFKGSGYAAYNPAPTFTYQNGVYFPGSYATVANCYCDSMSGSFVQAYHPSLSLVNYNSVLNCTVTNSSVGVLDYVNSEYITIENCIFSNNDYNLIIFGGNHNISNCHLDYGVTTNLKLNGTSNGDHGTFTGCSFNHASGDAITLLNTPVGELFTACNFFYGQMHITDCDNLSFENCALYTPTITTTASTTTKVTSFKGGYYDPTITFTTTGTAKVIRSGIMAANINRLDFISDSTKISGSLELSGIANNTADTLITWNASKRVGWRTVASILAGVSAWGLSGNSGSGTLLGRTDAAGFDIISDGFKRITLPSTNNGSVIFGNEVYPNAPTQYRFNYCNTGAGELGGQFFYDNCHGYESTLTQSASGNFWILNHATGSSGGITLAYLTNPSDGSQILNSSGGWYVTNKWGVGGFPTQALDVTGNIRLSGALMPNNLPGTSGQVLTSAGAGSPPTWGAAPVTSNIYTADGTLGGNRLVTGGGNSFTLNGTSSFQMVGGDFASYPYSNISGTTGTVSGVTNLSASAFSQFLNTRVGLSGFNKLLGSGFRVVTGSGSNLFYMYLDSNHLKMKADSITIVNGLPSGAGTNTVRIDGNGRLFQANNDTMSLASFTAGSTAAGDTTVFSTTALYGSFYNSGSDTLVITSAQVGLQGTSPSVLVKIYYNDSLNVTAGATTLVNAGNTCTNIYTGTSITSFDNTKIPPGVWVWVSTPTVTTKPNYFSLTLIGYKKLR